MSKEHPFVPGPVVGHTTFLQRFLCKGTFTTGALVVDAYDLIYCRLRVPLPGPVDLAPGPVSTTALRPSEPGPQDEKDRPFRRLSLLL